tara:strand:- start:163 stop:390 length:228 start_codon:yes stop_codon:yes gene_type:complete
MPKFYKGSWVHFVHFNQFPSRKPKIVSFSKEPLPPKVPRELSPQEKKHRERMRRLYTEYDEWPEEKKEKFFKNDK